jgi:hypothetical protein
MATQIIKPNLLVVEGKDDEYLFEALINEIRIQNIQIISLEGKSNFRDRLEALKKTSGFATEVVSIGIVRDANDDPSVAFRSVCDALRNLSLPTPAHPLLSVGNNPRVTVMLLPSEDTPGMLEDLCLKSVEEDPAMICVDKYFNCLKKKNITYDSRKSKAKVQVFLSSRERLKKSLGEAAKAGYWPFNHIAFNQAKNFLQKIIHNENNPV